MNLRKLKHFLAVAEAGSFRKAAQSVYLSQPALSRSLQSLEDELGIPLFDRHDGRITPTAHSAPLIAHMRRLLADARRLDDAVRALKGLEEGEIRVGFGPFAAVTVMKSVLGEILSRYSRLKVQIELSNTSHLLELLQQDRLDIVVGDSRYSPKINDLESIPLPGQVFVFLTRADHELALKRRTFTLADLNGYPIASPMLPESLSQDMAAGGLRDMPTVMCEEMRVLLELAERSPLIVMAPKYLLDKQMCPPTLKPLPVTFPFDPRTSPCIMTAAGRIPGPAGLLLIELVREHFGADDPVTDPSSEAAA